MSYLEEMAAELFKLEHPHALQPPSLVPGLQPERNLFFLFFKHALYRNVPHHALVRCRQLREDKRRLMELLSGRTILGMDLLGPAVGRSISLDSTVTASDLRVMCARAGLDQGGLRGDPCVGIPGDSDTYDTATHRALLLEQAVGATQLERFDALFKDKLGSGDY